MIRLLFDARFITPQRTGVGRVTEKLLENLLMNHPDLEIHVLHNQGLPDHLKGNFPEEVSVLFDSHPGGDLHRNIALRKMIADKKLDLFFSPAFYSIQKGRSIPQVVLIHDLAVFDQPGSENPAFRIYLRKMIESSVRNATVLTTASNYIRDRIIERFDVHSEKVRAVHLGVDPIFGQFDDSRAEDRRKHYCLPSQFLLNVATIEPRKNLIKLIDGYSIYKRRALNPLPLILIGKDGFQSKLIHERAERSDVSTHIRFLGYVPDEDISQLYGLASGLVYPSLYEGFGLPVIEAMLSGCPVITSNRTSLPEVTGDAAILVDPDDSLSISQAITNLCNDLDLRQSLSIKGRIRAREFTWKKTADEYAEIFNSVMQNQRVSK